VDVAQGKLLRDIQDLVVERMGSRRFDIRVVVATDCPRQVVWRSTHVRLDTLMGLRPTPARIRDPRGRV
jgi:transcriptional regulator with GAF, ATPase, and Fis domain